MIGRPLPSLHALSPYSKVSTVLRINYQAPRTVVLYTHLIFPDLTKSKNLISRTPVSPEELLSLMSILGFFKDTDTFLFVFTFFFFKKNYYVPEECIHYAGGKRRLACQRKILAPLT